MIWRLATLCFYVGLALAVGIAYGGRGLVVLLFFYAWAGAFVVFMRLGGQLVRDVSSRRFPEERVTSS